jgi:hypothetical protein
MDSALSLSTWSGARKTLVLTLLVLILLPFLYASLPHGLDWHDTYRPAALAVLHGQSPYTVEIYYAAPWAAWLLIPFAVLPTSLGQMMIFLSGVAAYTYIAWRLGAPPVSLFLFLSSAAVIGCLINGNIEWLPLLGAVLPPQIGLILLAVKPQVGLGLGLYWLITIWRQRGFREVVITFAPVGVLLLLSLLLYGLWPLRFSQTVAWSSDNVTLFPYGIGIGLVLLVRAFQTRDSGAALASGPLFSPYVIHFTWACLLVYFLQKPKLLLAAVIALWIPIVLKTFLM